MSGVSFEVLVSATSVFVVFIGGSCAGFSFSVSSNSGIGRDDSLFFRRKEVLLQERRSARASLAEEAPEAEDLVEEKVELRRNSGFRRARRSPMTSFAASLYAQLWMLATGTYPYLTLSIGSSIIAFQRPSRGDLPPPDLLGSVQLLQSQDEYIKIQIPELI